MFHPQPCVDSCAWVVFTLVLPLITAVVVLGDPAGPFSSPYFQLVKDVDFAKDVLCAYSVSGNDAQKFLVASARSNLARFCITIVIFYIVVRTVRRDAFRCSGTHARMHADGNAKESTPVVVLFLYTCGCHDRSLSQSRACNYVSLVLRFPFTPAYRSTLLPPFALVRFRQPSPSTL